MGFRSTLITEHNNLDWPAWFVEKYEPWLHIKNGLLSSRNEVKTYVSPIIELEEDIQRAIREVWEPYPDEEDRQFVLVWLHECGGISRCAITRNTIRWSEPSAWRETDEITHNYCYGCSDLPAS